MAISSKTARALLSGLYLSPIHKAGTVWGAICDMQMPEQSPFMKGQW